MKWGAKITFGMLAVSVIFSTAVLGRNLWMQEKEQVKFEELRNRISAEKKENGSEVDSKKPNEGREVLPEYQEVAEENPDFVGWILIEGTNINYPVMQTSWEPEYYLHRDFTGEYSYVGVPFVGSGNIKAEDGDIFIYGHNMRNGSMFADLLQYQKEEFWRTHPVIALDTLWEHRRYEVFAAFYANENEWMQEGGRIYRVLHKNNVSRTEAFRILKEAGAYDTGITPEQDSSLLYLATCSYQEPGSRFVVAGVLIDEELD